MNTTVPCLSRPWRLIARLRDMRWQRFAGALCRADGWREVDAHTLRDLGVDASEFGSIAAEAAGAAPGMRRRIAGGMVAIAAVVVAGCASVGAPQHAHTLAGYDQLQLQPDGTRAWRDAAFGRPSAVVVDTAAISFAIGVPLDAAEQQVLRDALRQALAERLAAAGLRVQEAGDGADRLRLRATITAVERAQPALNAVTTLLLFAPLSYGGLSVEIEAFDAESGRRVAALAFAGRAGLQDFGASFSDLGHARAQAEVVAGRFAALLAAPAPAEIVSGASPGRPLR